jgi:hypothetical protein
MGKSGIVLANNLLRMSAIPAALAGLALIGGLAGLVAGLIAGEIIANLAATLLVNRHAGWGITRDLDRILLFLTASAAILAGAAAAQWHSAAAAGAAALLGGIAILGVARREAATIREARTMLLKLGRRG